MTLFNEENLNFLVGFSVLLVLSLIFSFVSMNIILSGSYVISLISIFITFFITSVFSRLYFFGADNKKSWNEKEGLYVNTMAISLALYVLYIFLNYKYAIVFKSNESTILSIFFPSFLASMIVVKNKMGYLRIFSILLVFSYLFFESYNSLIFIANKNSYSGYISNYFIDSSPGSFNFKALVALYITVYFCALTESLLVNQLFERFSRK